MDVVITLVGLGLIALTYWFFLGKKEEKGVMVDKEIVITVEWGYKPSAITVKKGQLVTLKFLRKDASSCLEEVVVPEFKIRQFLELGKTTEVKITPDRVGEFTFSCGMNMFHGKLKVV